MRFADRREVLNSAGLELDRLGDRRGSAGGDPRLASTRQREPYEVFGATGGAALLPPRDARPGRRLRRDASSPSSRTPTSPGAPRRTAGGRSYAPRAVVYHHHSATAQHGSPAKLYLVGRNRVRTLAKNATTGMLLPQRPLDDRLRRRLRRVRLGRRGRTLAPLRGRLRGLREWRSVPPRRRAAPPAAAAAPAARASAGRWSATSATPSTSRPERRRGEHAGRRRSASRRRPRARRAARRCARRSCTTGSRAIHGAERTVAAMLDLFAPRPGHLHVPRRARAAAAAPGLRRSCRSRAWAASRACASAATTRAAGAGCSPTCRATSSGSTCPATSWCMSSSHACAAGVRTRPDDAPRLLLPHADALRVDAGGGAQPGQRSQGRGAAGRCAAGCGAGTATPRSGPDLYMANSTAVAERITRFYGRDAVVVPPPVAVGDFPATSPRDPARFLWVHRLVPYKRPLEVAEAFRGLPDLRLTMVGVGPLEAQLRASPAATTSSCSAGCSRERLAELFAGAGGLHPRGRGGLRHLDGRGAGRRRAGAGRRSRRRPRHRAARRGRRADRRTAPSPEQIRAGVRELAGRRLGRRRAAPERAALLREALPRAPRRGAARPRRTLT